MVIFLMAAILLGSGLTQSLLEARGRSPSYKDLTFKEGEEIILDLSAGNIWCPIPPSFLHAPLEGNEALPKKDKVNI